MTAGSDASVRRYEERLLAAGEPFYDLTLYVSGASDLAARAIVNARHLCEGHLAGHSRLSVVDVQDDIAAVRASGILATPTLVKNLPLPSRKVVGDLSHTARVILGLDLPFTSSGGANDAQPGA